MKTGGSPILRRKRRAAEEFVERLLKSEVGPSIVGVILFGSVLKGTASAQSDVDLIVIASGELRKVEEVCDEIGFSILMEMGERIEPLCYPLVKLRYPDTYFLSYNLSRGEVLYMIPEERLKWEEANGYLELAEEYREAARAAFESGHVRLAVDAAYNAVELAAKGLLRFELEDMPSSHGGLVQQVGRVLIKSGILPLELGRRMNRALSLRDKARYDPQAEVRGEDFEEVYELAGRFIERLRERLEEGGERCRV